LTLPNGVTVAYTFDNDSHILRLSYALGGQSLGNLTYAYDANGRVITKGGSLAAVNLPAAVSGNSFNAANEMTAFNGTALTHDANGNLTGDGTNTYTWDARNHLSAVSGATTASFVYDAFGRRMSKALNGVTTEFLYDGLNPVQELNGGNPPSPTANLLTGLDIDEYFTRTDTSGAMSFLADALGSSIALTDSNGSINTSYTYEPFGNTTVAGSNGNPYQFTGRENDATGLYFYRARYYSPTLQRFIAQDPIGFAGGDPNLYGYVQNGPVSNTDQYGLETGAVSVGRYPGGPACTCPPVPEYPCGRSPQNTENNSHFLDIPQLILDNRNGGLYDFKLLGSQYDAAGNFNFGIEAGSIGILPWLAHLGAGFYHQYYGGFYDPSVDGTWWDPSSYMGDSPSGYNQISNGYQYVECQCGH
jgi:RHS repeat-associated protein